MNFEAGAAYAERHGLEALLVRREGETIFERYAAGFDAHIPHALYSGTKSFWGVVAAAAVDDGLISLDEPVGETFPGWSVGRKAFVTLRQLLSLTSGIGFGGLGNAVPSYEKALAVEVKNEPGGTFTYGGIPLQVFGAVLAAKLSAAGKGSPHDYLRARLLEPIGVTIASWRTLSSGTQPLPTGAFVSAEQWERYGSFVLAGGVLGRKRVVSESALAACFTGSPANPRYGLGWWLAPDAAPGLAYASGSGGQAMYLFRAERTVVVKFGCGSGYKHESFLKKLVQPHR
jgi:CubicO group peptidase (beta-lactamase class C family)